MIPSGELKTENTEGGSGDGGLPPRLCVLRQFFFVPSVLNFLCQ